MAKQNKKIWRGWTPCKNKKCNGRKTYGGIKILGLFRLKKWEHPCKCVSSSHECETEDTKWTSEKQYNTPYDIIGNKVVIPTELDKEKCEEVLRKQKEQKDDNKTTNG